MACLVNQGFNGSIKAKYLMVVHPYFFTSIPGLKSNAIAADLFKIKITSQFAIQNAFSTPRVAAVSFSCSH